MEELLEIAKEAALAGGKEILEVYNGEIKVDMKEDKSPLTEADKNAHNAIVKFLDKTGIPVLSEEGKSILHDIRKNWKRLWIVDPLDGTKEFIKRNGEFTVNIALIENGLPVMGVIYVPVKEVLYFGMEGLGSFKSEKGQTVKLPQPKQGERFVAVGSRSHMSEETENYFNELKEQHGEIDVVSMGSSLKICLVAEGVADVYPRFAPTMEWDTAAGHAIAKFAGKTLIDYKTKEEMRYNRYELLNNWFIVE
ncbi:3'(2'),5'-bisphosphate nucleotidase CysQ [Parvicella tangerina]|uniref:3'(2'),5'-bisphosphate nucleotidase CysQ n=1 Tax=Parvicella tangerina TaxID=2829795 RepID=A0A916NT74_9FLAO|nr:3'(2'),5'-bisphosphate nucleotidase CysQ [Parvicella tangerina]CAG5085461.1 3'(2'),5'-bisphosphate nucleotidase CysQ [Parvicella tangerina]